MKVGDRLEIRGRFYKVTEKEYYMPYTKPDGEDGFVRVDGRTTNKGWRITDLMWRLTEILKDGGKYKVIVEKEGD